MLTLLAVCRCGRCSTIQTHIIYTTMENSFNNKINDAVDAVIGLLDSIKDVELFRGEWPENYTRFDIYCHKCLIEHDVRFIKTLRNIICPLARIVASNIELTDDEILDAKLYSEELYEATGEVEPDEDMLLDAVLRAFDIRAVENADRLEAQAKNDEEEKDLQAAVEHDLDILRESLKRGDEEENWDDDTDDCADDEEQPDDAPAGAFISPGSYEDSDDIKDEDSEADDSEAHEPHRLVPDCKEFQPNMRLFDSFSVAGVQFHDAGKAWRELFVGAPVRIVRDSKNPYDCHAVALWNVNLIDMMDSSNYYSEEARIRSLVYQQPHQGKSYMLGFVPRHRNTGLAALLDSGYAGHIYAEIAALGWNPPRHRIDVNVYIERNPEVGKKRPFIYEVDDDERRNLARELAITGSIRLQFDIEEDLEERMPNDGDTVCMVCREGQKWIIYRLLITRMNLTESRDHIEYIMANTYGPLFVPFSRFDLPEDERQIYEAPEENATELERLFNLGTEWKIADI